MKITITKTDGTIITIEGENEDAVADAAARLSPVSVNPWYPYKYPWGNIRIGPCPVCGNWWCDQTHFTYCDNKTNGGVISSGKNPPDFSGNGVYGYGSGTTLLGGGISGPGYTGVGGNTLCNHAISNCPCKDK